MQLELLVKEYMYAKVVEIRYVAWLIWKVRSKQEAGPIHVPRR